MMQISWEILPQYTTSLSDNFLKPSNTRRKDRKHINQKHILWSSVISKILATVIMEKAN